MKISSGFESPDTKKGKLGGRLGLDAFMEKNKTSDIRCGLIRLSLQVDP